MCACSLGSGDPTSTCLRRHGRGRPVGTSCGRPGLRGPRLLHGRRHRGRDLRQRGDPDLVRHGSHRRSAAPRRWAPRVTVEPSVLPAAMSTGRRAVPSSTPIPLAVLRNGLLQRAGHPDGDVLAARSSTPWSTSAAWVAATAYVPLPRHPHADDARSEPHQGWRRRQLHSSAAPRSPLWTSALGTSATDGRCTNCPALTTGLRTRERPGHLGHLRGGRGRHRRQRHHRPLATVTRSSPVATIDTDFGDGQLRKTARHAVAA